MKRITGTCFLTGALLSLATDALAQGNDSIPRKWVDGNFYTEANYGYNFFGDKRDTYDFPHAVVDLNIHLGKGWHLSTEQEFEYLTENKTIALQLGLPETATEAEITAKLTALKSAEAEKSKLELEKAQLESARITGLVERAIGEKRLGESNKEEFINLGKKVGYEELEKVLKAMHPQAKLTAILNGGRAKSDEDVKYTKLSEVPSAEILTLREQNPKEYARLYKAEYGMELPE